MSDLKVILIFPDKIQAYILNNNLRADRIGIVLSYKKDLLSYSMPINLCCIMQC